MIDEILLTFVRENLVTISLALGVLKLVANETPWAIDNEILQIFTKFLGRNK